MRIRSCSATSLAHNLRHALSEIGQQTTCILTFCQSMVLAPLFCGTKYFALQPSPLQAVGDLKKPSCSSSGKMQPHLGQRKSSSVTNGLMLLALTTVPLIVTSLPASELPELGGTDQHQDIHSFAPLRHHLNLCTWPLFNLCSYLALETWRSQLFERMVNVF